MRVLSEKTKKQEVSRMKKRILIVSIIVALLCCAMIFVACDDNTANNEITRRNAQLKSIALSTVGAEGVATDYTNVTNDRQGNFVVEVVINGVKYDVTIGQDQQVVDVQINDRQVDKNNIPEAPFGTETNYIGKDSAKNIALTDAGVQENVAVGLEVKFDFDDGQYLYEVEFKVGRVEYEYDINATTGTIHKKEIDDKTVIEQAPQGVEFIGVEAAQQVALTAANIAVEDIISTTKAKLDFDNGAYVYDIEFYTATAQYEYEINAVTGAVIKYEIDHVTGGQQTGDYIGIESAKDIAIAHAGVEIDKALVEAELDNDDGVYYYSVEFVSGEYEYEYEIDAVNGNVLKMDKELHN